MSYLMGDPKDVLQRDFSRLFAFDLTLTDEEYHFIVIKVIMESRRRQYAGIPPDPTYE
jgi:hypothetical protein